ncbi:metal ABC transporter substrate-binding protein [Wenjunlia tyrosinilytica]|uniref:Zinc ABC transporter substrate-binding protein n=1 Tax=Wenjunlia tyrosinilytica TaxID=1544741 RepID=A0A917ZD80_9ACTN|nr:metal ABC transporter substrate-binding protein [Wenjunlia tyrosinilytica]GGO80678.1 zinc ABC transporter substrate-binding protein [Wenjunlia tyrosinilytica]
MNVRRRLVPGLLAAAAATSMIALTGCSPESGGSGNGKVDATASFYPLEYITKRIGGEHVNVTGLTKPGVEPHDLELTPRQVGRLSDTDLVVYLKGLQPAVDEAVSQAHPKHLVEATRYSPLVAHGEEVDAVHGGTAPEEGGHGENASGDPHIWLDPTRLAKVAEGVNKQLAAADPAHAASYKANTDKLVGELNALDKEFTEGLSGVKRRTFVTTHAAFGYLAERYRLDEVGISGLDPEAEPSPAHLADLHRTAEEKKVSTIFFETLANPKTAKTLAEDLHLKTAVLDPVEGVRDPKKSDYFSVMRQNLKNLQAALGSS